MRILSFVLCLFPMISMAQTSRTSWQEPKAWAVEAQYNTMSNSASPTFGPSMLYKIDSQNQVGARLLAPMGNENNGTYSFGGLYRFYFTEEKTSLFLEGSLSSNWYYNVDTDSNLNSPSLGTNLGVLHQLNEDIAFGGSAGLEWTEVRLNRGQASRTSNLVLWGRLSLFASLAF